MTTACDHCIGKYGESMAAFICSIISVWPAISIRHEGISERL